MKCVIAAIAALCMMCLQAFAQNAPQKITTAGTGKTFCSGYEQALAVANRTAGQPYQRPPTGCFAVSPEVSVTTLQSYPKLQSGGSVSQVQLGRTTGFLAFSLAPSTPPTQTLKTGPSRPVASTTEAPTAKPTSSGTFATASLPPVPGPLLKPAETPSAGDDVQSPKPKIAKRSEPMVPIGEGKSMVGDWMVSVEKDRFDGADQVVAIGAGNNNRVAAVRCLKGESSLALLGEFEAGQVAEIKFRVDNNPVVATLGSAINANVLQILTTDDMLRQMLDAREFAFRISTPRFSYDAVFKLERFMC